MGAGRCHIITEKESVPRFIAFLEKRKEKTSVPHTHTFWQTPDFLNPQNPHPICALNEPD